MNLGPTEARAFIAAFTARWTPRTDRTIVFFPPAISLEAVVDAIGPRRDLDAGVQNIWTEDRGAFTGETSAPMAKDARAKYALVGHSERRHVFGETDEQTAKKCAGRGAQRTRSDSLRRRTAERARGGVDERRRAPAACAPDSPTCRRTSLARWRSRTSPSGRSARDARRRRTTRPPCTRKSAARSPSMSARRRAKFRSSTAEA